MDLSKSNSSTCLAFGQYLYIIRFGSKLYRQNVGIPMGTNCAPLLLICFYFAMRGLHEVSHKGKRVWHDKCFQFNFLDDLLMIDNDNIHIEQMVQRIYPADFQLNKANASGTEAAF